MRWRGVLGAALAGLALAAYSGGAPSAHRDQISREVHNAYAYASHCGGVVQVEPLYDGKAHEDGTIGRHDVVVVGCDR